MHVYFYTPSRIGPLTTSKYNVPPNIGKYIVHLIDHIQEGDGTIYGSFIMMSTATYSRIKHKHFPLHTMQPKPSKLLLLLQSIFN